MTKLVVIESPKGYYSLQGDLNRNTIAQSDALALLENTCNEDVATLDMSGVKHSDTSALAWLLNFLKDNQQQNIRFELKNIPKSLIKLAKISDVDSFLSVQ
ncbi:MAG: STAS domain-containing protein [Paraglaciecola sp.]|nr:STAS domain-containing protein [Paraglaciecola sp.]